MRNTNLQHQDIMVIGYWFKGVSLSVIIILTNRPCYPYKGVLLSVFINRPYYPCTIKDVLMHLRTDSESPSEVSLFVLRFRNLPITRPQCSKSAPRTTGGPRDQLKQSAIHYINQYFVFRGPQNYSKWTVRRKNWLYFTNILMLSFYARRSQKRKKTDDLTPFFTLLGCACIKAVCITLMKLSPGVLTSQQNLETNSLLQFHFTSLLLLLLDLAL